VSATSSISAWVISGGENGILRAMVKSSPFIRS
jgi:hypothetical protein